MNDVAGVATFLVVAAFMLLAGLLTMAPLYHAWRRGYNIFVWGAACLLSLNPIFILVVLAIVPHRRRLRLRDQFTRELDEKLSARADGSAGPPAGLGDASPIDTSAVGDRATLIPGDRSIGDDQTRL